MVEVRGDHEVAVWCATSANDADDVDAVLVPRGTAAPKRKWPLERIADWLDPRFFVAAEDVGAGLGAPGRPRKAALHVVSGERFEVLEKLTAVDRRGLRPDRQGTNGNGCASGNVSQTFRLIRAL